MKKKKFASLKKKYFEALLAHKNAEASDLYMRMLGGIIERKEKGKSVSNLNFH